MEDGVEVVAGLDLGQEEVLSAICRLGRGLVGSSALAEAGVEGLAEAFEGGFWPIHGMDIQCHTWLTELIRSGILQRNTWHTGEGESKMAWPRRGRRYQRWWGYPPQYPYAYPPPGQIPPQQYTYPPYAYPPPMYPPATPPIPQSPEDELAALEDYKKELEDEKASMEQEISDVETRIKELKAMLEKGKGQPPGQ